jgi:hypothetical protein
MGHTMRIYRAGATAATTNGRGNSLPKRGSSCYFLIEVAAATTLIAPTC